jgi:thioredoxin-like negative regulator of GroEL
MEPVLDQLAREYAGRAIIAKVNVDENRQLAEEYRILAIPNLKIFKGGKPVENIIGAVPVEQIKEPLDRHV